MQPCLGRPSTRTSLGSGGRHFRRVSRTPWPPESKLLMAYGPKLPYPYSSDVTTSRHRVMRELRIQRDGRPLRVFYAFDPRRTSILLIGGDKSGNDRFYQEYVPVADALYDEHLEELRREGLIK